MTSLVCKEIAQICLQNVLIPRFNVFFYIKPYTDQHFTYYYMMSANWVSVKIMVPSECRPTGFLPTAQPPTRYTSVMSGGLICNKKIGTRFLFHNILVYSET